MEEPVLIELVPRRQAVGIVDPNVPGVGTRLNGGLAVQGAGHLVQRVDQDVFGRVIDRHIDTLTLAGADPGAFDAVLQGGEGGVAAATVLSVSGEGVKEGEEDYESCGQNFLDHFPSCCLPPKKGGQWKGTR